MAQGHLFLLEDIAAEKVYLVVHFFNICLLINENGCVHRNDAEAGGFNLLFEPGPLNMATMPCIRSPQGRQIRCGQPRQQLALPLSW